MHPSCDSAYEEWLDFLSKYNIGFEKLDIHSNGDPGLSLKIEAQKSKNVEGYRGFMFTVEFNDDLSFKQVDIFE